MKTESNVRPDFIKVEKFGNMIEISICENIIEVEDMFQYDYLFKQSYANDYKELVQDIIRTKYSSSDEFNLINENYIERGNVKYLEYLDFRTLAKQEANKIYPKEEIENEL
ncbi:hypothetical protein [Anaerorhabdus sp.]|uniref:hypothetical protein n=1 Tax=Anaerorhabdus sp. TaxID=1872524 RepID=UPI002FC6B8B1